MSAAGQPKTAGRPRWIGWVSGSVVAALVVTLAVIANGFDSRETPREDPSVWVERVAGQYARVNTVTAEIDTVRTVESPSGVVQTADLGLLLTQGFGRAWAIDAASPVDVQQDGGAESDDETADGANDDSTGSDTDESDSADNGAGSAADTDEDSSEGGAAMRTPDGTRQVNAEGDFVLFFTQAGEAFLSRVTTAVRGAAGTQLGMSAASGADAQNSQSALGAKAELTTPVLLDPIEAEESTDGDDGDGSDEAEQERYVADAAALNDKGLVALFSNAEQSIRWFDAVTGDWRGGPERVPAEIVAEEVQLAIVDGRWVLLDSAAGELWVQGRDTPIEFDFTGPAQLQTSTASSTEGRGGFADVTTTQNATPASDSASNNVDNRGGNSDSARNASDILIADEGGLWSISRDGDAERVVETTGVAAQPRFVAGEAVSAWVGPSSASMWTSAAGETDLQLDETVEDLTNPELEVRSNGSRALVVERRSGMMWTVPEGRLIPVEQWSLIDPPKKEAGTVITQDVTEQEPPVAVDDVFGVRAGEPAPLPVLLNDYDPNRKDVLTVVPDGLGEGLDSDFGSVSALSDGQGLIVHPSETAQGSTTFSYRVTDGTNVSPPATVTLNVVDEATNTAPQWCPVEGCQRTWPSPELSPGGTMILPILEGWVDPEGDPMMLAGASVVNPDDPMRALVTADGRLAIRHSDTNAPAGDVVVRVALVDSRGAEIERDLRVRVRTGAAIEFSPAAATAKVGEAISLRPLERVTGGSGSFQLVDAALQQGSMSVTTNPGTGVIEVLTDAPGSATVAVTVRDTITEQETVGVIRVTSVESRGDIGIPPLRAFVRPLADSTIDVLAAIPGANSRALTVQSASVNDGQLRADVIEHSRVRVSGTTADGQPGRIGSVDVVVTEGEATAVGRLTVFQVADEGSGAIAVSDTATVRAGSVVDIPVLENDVAPPGERLVLHPEVGASGADGELAFASGGNVRYLAPKTAGDYTLSYTTYGASSPEQSDVGQVRVTVLPTGSNRDPQPSTVTVRVAPGERVTTTVPLSAVDPDGDRLRLVSVDSPDNPQLSTSILPRSNSLQVGASSSAQRSLEVVGYTVRDSYGGEATGKLRVIVTDPDPGGGAPVVYSDYVRIAHGTTTPAVVRPLLNDLDPSGGALELVSVEPNVPGGESSVLYQDLAKRLDLSGMKQGIVRVVGGEDLGTVSYRYTVQSTESRSTADGLIVVQVSERIGQQAPAVQDTVLSVRDRADFERTGVDVVTDRVRWASGDASTLKLSLWGSAANRYTVEGSRIVGSYRADGDLVPFRLAGTDMTGAEVETFGFLIVPPLDELRLTLEPNVKPISVEENKSVDVRIADMIEVGQGDRIELDQATFPTQRGQASCAATGETTIRYTAGKEAPWSDYCTIRVRLTEQTTYTTLPIPVSIVPNEPVAQLNPLTRTVAPGASETINLTDMVQWQGAREGDASKLRWRVSGNSSAFEVATSGSQVQVQARADAVPGSQEVLTVAVSGAGETQSLLTLRVGVAPVDAPRGGTVSLQCTVGSSCSTPLVGIGGEYDPFAGKSGSGLHLVSVDGGGCQFGSMQASGNSVSVSWADSRGPGGSCTANFTVRDAQNRTGKGSIEFDALGVPRAPTNIAATGANATSVTLTVTLSSQTSHPGVTGVEILSESGNPVASCSPSGNVAVCTVSGVPVGKDQARRYLARALNDVGPSDPTGNASEPTWAYEAPPAPTVTAEAVKNPRNTEQASGQVNLELSGSDRARRFLLTIDRGERVEVGRYSTHTLAPGPHRFTVIPEDRNLPPGYSGSGEGSAGTAEVIVGAAPILEGVALQPVGDNGAKLVFSSDANYADPSTLEFRYGISSPNGSSANCNQGSPDFTNLTELRSYVGVLCAQSEFGRTTVTTEAVWIGGNPPQLEVTRGYSIGSQASGSGNVREYITVGGGSSQPAVSGRVDGATLRYTTSAGTTSAGSLPTVPVGASVTVQQCLSGNGMEYCSDPVTVPAAGLPSTRVTWTGTCVADGGNYASVFNVQGRAKADATFAKQGANNVRVSWVDGFNNTDFSGVICAPDPEPEPDPEPDPGDGGG